jgi:hypothetical protein
MADSKSSELRPLVSENVGLRDTNNGQFSLVDYVQVRQRRRRIIVGTLLTCCLGACLVVGVTVPVVNSHRKQQQQPDGVNSGAVMLMAMGDGDAVTQWTTTDRGGRNEDDSTTPSFRPHPSWWWNVTFPTRTTTDRHHRHTTTPEQPSTSSATTESTTSASWLPETCRRTRPGRVVVADVTNRTWYEVLRVQTYNSPAYADRVSCSTLLLIATETEAVEEATVHLEWRERKRGTFFERETKNQILYLYRNDTSSPDWVATVDQSTAVSQFSLLTRLGRFLVVYECFPEVTWYPRPGYAIHVYTTDPNPGYQESRLAESLMSIAGRWGFNPVEISSEWIRQRYCDLDIDYVD